MAEYIEREAALSGYQTVCDGVECSRCPIRGNGHCKFEEYLRAIPAADVRPVVLCRDCEYFSDVMYGGMQFEYGYCDRWADGTRMNPDDFCSHAAKKEES